MVLPPCFVFICLSDHRSGGTVHEGEGRAAGGCIPGYGSPRQDLLLTIWETRKLKERGRNEARLQSSMSVSDPLLPAKLCLLCTSIPPNRIITEEHEFKHKRLQGHSIFKPQQPSKARLKRRMARIVVLFSLILAERMILQVFIHLYISIYVNP